MLFSTLMWKLYVKHFYENAAKIKMQWEGYDLASIKSRKIELFNMLQKENIYRPTSYYAKALGVSEKSIYNDISELNDKLSNYNLEIVKIPRKGLLLKGQLDNCARFIEDLNFQNELVIVNYSRSYRRLKILESILLKNSSDIRNLADRFSITVNSLLNDIKEMQIFFSKYDVRIYHSNDYLYVDGTEYAIQKAFSQYLLMLFENDFNYELNLNDESLMNLVSSIFDSSLVVLVKDEIESFSALTKKPIENYYKISLFLSMLVEVSRISMDKHINEDNEQLIFEKLNYYEPYLMAVDVADEFEKRIGLIFSKGDLIALSEKIFINRIEPSIAGNILLDKYLPVVDEIVEKMSRLLEIDIRDDMHLKDSLLFHIPAMIYRLKNGYVVKNPLLNQIRKQYMVLFTLTWYATSVMESEFNISLNDDEVSFMLIHFQLAIEKKYIQKNIVVVCENGIATSELMYNTVMRILPYRDNIRTITMDELKNSDLSKIDFIISTVDIPDIGIDVIKVSNLMKEDDIRAIVSHYSDLSNKITYLKNTSNINDIDFNRYFSEELIFIDKDFTSKDDCLDFIALMYEKNNLVTNSFRKMIFSRENLGDTALSTGVAIPHANPDTVLETKIGIIRLKNKIKWGNVDVDMIFVLGISEKDIDKIKNLVGRVLEIADDENSLNQLRNVKNIREMRLMMRELI